MNEDDPTLIVTYQTPEQIKDYLLGVVNEENNPSADKKNCIRLATCLRVTWSPNERYFDKSFRDTLMKKFVEVKNMDSLDLETRVATMLVTTVYDAESTWVEDYGQNIGEPPKDMIDWVKRTLVEHTKSARDSESLSDLAAIFNRVKAGDCMLKLDDLKEIVEAFENMKNFFSFSDGTVEKNNLESINGFVDWWKIEIAKKNPPSVDGGS